MNEHERLHHKMQEVFKDFTLAQVLRTTQKQMRFCSEDLRFEHPLKEDCDMKTVYHLDYVAFKLGQLADFCKEEGLCQIMRRRGKKRSSA